MKQRLSTILLICLFSTVIHAAEFTSDWHTMNDRVWIGKQYWANPMEDWRVHDGRLECITPGGDRNVHTLTYQMNESNTAFSMSVKAGLHDQGNVPGSVGFEIGIQDQVDDYRTRCFFGNGINAGITRHGVIFIGDVTQTVTTPPENVTLKLEGLPEGDQYTLNLQIEDSESGDMVAEINTNKYSANRLSGNIALVQNHHLNQNPKNSDCYWFSHWTFSGDKIDKYSDQTFGPILWSMHTLSRGVLKMTAQMPPFGPQDSNTVALQIKDAGEWQTIAEEKIDANARTALFRIEDWDDSNDVLYRLAYTLKNKDGSNNEHYWEGTVRKDPVDKELVVAGFTGNTDRGFPNREISRNVSIHDPDVLFFSGDQLYEGVGGYGIIREPVDRANLNYQRKWYMFGWAFGDIMRDRVTICLPDDHDVYQGNIWGNGGNATTMADHDAGGFAMHPTFVNAVIQTQTGHHPDLYDPTPIQQGINVFYGDMLYGRVSFAIIADRMFKSGPKGTVATWEGRPDHVKNPNFDPESVNKPGLILLGDRQLKFLRDWAADWKGADMKMMLSQTIFCNLANYHGHEQMYLVADLDSNGWPQDGRDRALAEIRKGFAFHLAGDQHLASIVHHGIGEHRDAGFSFCVPSIAAGYPRSWLADDEGRPVVNRPDPKLPNTGDYIDGLGNKMTVYAIGNPEKVNRPGRLNTLHDKASGYGIVRMNKDDRTFTMECWRLLVDVANPKPEDQFPGWPKTISMYDNYGREALEYLPEIHVDGIENPVVQVINEVGGDIVYTVRANGTTFRPKIFEKSTYTIKIGNPDVGKMKSLTGIQPASSDETIKIEF